MAEWLTQLADGSIHGSTDDPNLFTNQANIPELEIVMNFELQIRTRHTSSSL